MSIELLLDRLDGVRERGSGRWIAKCPAHPDVHPSLSIRITDDGLILLHDFGGCATTDVLAAVGLTTGDLFPERFTHHAARSRSRPNHWHAMRDAIRVLHMDCLIVAIAAEDIARGRSISDDDLQLVTEAAGRVRAAIEVCT